ncbi:hypothetical protein IMCC3317_11570 [Kordia antarctica]|uniref:Peptidase C14 caspase domain-containing protein n=1 Tax=Kordia antarctica TaxID=1218801 RepID=A0A7L4ZH99_9FLAO|nr:caspase family protein [Kordia antarctica]QHI35809.1 hypothetical protein IMCC3317_11570 [Kordia antarctica]
MNYVQNTILDSLIDTSDELYDDTIKSCIYYTDYTVKLEKNCKHTKHSDDFVASNSKLQPILSLAYDKEETKDFLKDLAIKFDPLKFVSALFIIDISTIDPKHISNVDGEFEFSAEANLEENIEKYLKYVIINYNDRCVAYTKDGTVVFEEKMASTNFYNNGSFVLTSYEMISPLAHLYTGVSFAGFEIAKKNIFLLDFQFQNKQFVTSLKNQKRDGTKTFQVAEAFKKFMLSTENIILKNNTPKRFVVNTFNRNKKVVFDASAITKKTSYENLVITYESLELNLDTEFKNENSFDYEILSSFKDFIVVLKKEIYKDDASVFNNELILIGVADGQLKHELLITFFSYLQIEEIVLLEGNEQIEIAAFFLDKTKNTRQIESFIIDSFFEFYHNGTIKFNGTKNHLESNNGLYMLFNTDIGYTKNVYKEYTNVVYDYVDINNGNYYMYYDYEYPKDTFFINNITATNFKLDNYVTATVNDLVDAKNIETLSLYKQNLLDTENIQVEYTYEKVFKDEYSYEQKDTYRITTNGKEKSVQLKTYSRKIGQKYALSPSVLVGYSNDLKYFLFYSNDDLINGSLKVYDFEKGTFIFSKFLGGNRTSANIDYFQGMSFSVFKDKLIIRYNNVESEIYDLNTSEKLADYYYYSDDEWYVVTPSGLYDKSSKKTDKLYYVYDKKELFELDQFKKEYQYNDLLPLILGISDRSFPKQLNLQDEIKKLPPEIVYQIQNNKTLKGTIKKREGGARNIFFCIAGSEKKEIKPQFNSEGIASFKIDLSEFKDDYLNENNKIYVKASNATNTITSKGEILNFQYQQNTQEITKATEEDKNEPITNAKLYALFVGIENYDNRPLEYAEDDASDMKMCVELINKNLYTNAPEIIYLPNEEASKKNITDALKYIQEKANAEDVVLLYFSGHGITGEALENDYDEVTNRNFYFITEDFNYVNKEYFSELSIDENLESKQAISSTELNHFLAGDNMNAQKKILIMDACFSGRLLNPSSNKFAKSDENNLTYAQEKALQELNSKTGTIILTASRSDDRAYETENYQHSFLAWGLLKALKDKDYSKYGDNVKVDAWLKYAKYIVENEITDLNIQKPAISTNEDVDFAIGSVKNDILKNFTLAGALPIMNTADISAENPQSRGKAATIRLAINNQLKRYVEDKNSTDKKFTFRDSDYADSGYRIWGKISSKDNISTLTFSLLKDGKPIQLDMKSANNQSNPYEYSKTFDTTDLEKNIITFVKTIINQL